MSEEKILTKVRKMMAIANDSAATEGERDNALRMSYKLLAKYNLTMVDVEIHASKDEDKRKIYETVTRSQLWARHVCHIIAELFFCQYFSGRRINADKCVHHFVGKESNATTAMLMSEYVVQSLVKESRVRYKNDLTPEARSFCLGAVVKLRERVRELKEQQQSEMNIETTGTALVLADLYKREAIENALVVTDSGIRTEVGRSGKSTVKSSAYASGKEFGKSISLAPQVGSRGSSTLLK